VALTEVVKFRLSSDELEWVRRKAHWDNVSVSQLLRALVRSRVAEQGYLRPPDDEPQDFGYEKEMMQFVVSVQKELE
jgi:hypothetical protein